MKTAKCSKCNFEDTFEPDEFGINYFQAVGECPHCEAKLLDGDGIETKTEIIFKGVIK
jgi:hypothetical protein